jgi:hypothetical protein
MPATPRNCPVCGKRHKSLKTLRRHLRGEGVNTHAWHEYLIRIGQLDETRQAPPPPPPTGPARRWPLFAPFFRRSISPNITPSNPTTPQAASRSSISPPSPASPTFPRHDLSQLPAPHHSHNAQEDFDYGMDPYGGDSGLEDYNHSDLDAVAVRPEDVWRNHSIHRNPDQDSDDNDNAGDDGDSNSDEEESIGGDLEHMHRLAQEDQFYEEERPPPRVQRQPPGVTQLTAESMLADHFQAESVLRSFGEL